MVVQIVTVCHILWAHHVCVCFVGKSIQIQIYNFTVSLFQSIKVFKMTIVISFKVGAPSLFLLLLLLQVFHSRKPFLVPGVRIHCRKLWNPVCPRSDESTLGVYVSVQSLFKIPEAFHIFCPAEGKTAATRCYVKIPLVLISTDKKHDRSSTKAETWITWFTKNKTYNGTRCLWKARG